MVTKEYHVGLIFSIIEDNIPVGMISLDNSGFVRNIMLSDKYSTEKDVELFLLEIADKLKELGINKIQLALGKGIDKVAEHLGFKQEEGKWAFNV